MSLGLTMPLHEAAALADHLTADLSPHVERIQVVGSVRRRRPQVSDIELLIEPRLVVADLFGGLALDIGGLKAELERIGRIVKGGDRYIQVAEVYRSESTKLDVFMVSAPASWGALLAIRTGPVDLSKYLVTRMRRFGYQQTDGHAISIDTGEDVPTDTEEEFFKLAGVECVPPWERDGLIERIGRQLKGATQ